MSQQASGTKLIIQHDLAASWIMCNNRFSKPGIETADWSGVLFQLGDFKGNKVVSHVFDKVLLWVKGDPEPKSLKRGDFTWINIVSRPGGAGEPMKPNDAFCLFPKDEKGLDPCLNDPCSDLVVPADKKKCLRNRKIHWDQETVVAIITYWVGVNGFRVAAGRVASNKLSSRFEFTFEDECIVTVSRAEGPEMKPVPGHDYTWNDVTSVEVLARENGPTDGAQQDPPWPPTNP